MRDSLRSSPPPPCGKRAYLKNALWLACGLLFFVFLAWLLLQLARLSMQ